MHQGDNKNFFVFQRGGMLMELMLSVALAAIIIPFVFRYQKNTIERARNIAIVKQMATVQAALERCIFENRGTIVNQGVSVLSESNTNPDVIDCLILSDYKDNNPKGLVNYGLTREFANDFRGDYKLRILKSADYTNQPVLQGVVLLNNHNISALRTREIARLGGGQVGFLEKEDNYVHGGYKSFDAEKIEFGFQGDDEGVVETTETMRGNSKYLWRLNSNNNEDATMLSDLNLDGHNIVDVTGIYGSALSSVAKFNNLEITDTLNATYANFYGDQVNPNDEGGVYRGTKAEVHGNLILGNGDLIVENGVALTKSNAKENGDVEKMLYVGNFNSGQFNALNATYLTLSNFDINSARLDTTDLYWPKIGDGYTIASVSELALTPQLKVDYKICSTSSGVKKCWDMDKGTNIADFGSLKLTGTNKYPGLHAALEEIIASESSYTRSEQPVNPGDVNVSNNPVAAILVQYTKQIMTDYLDSSETIQNDLGSTLSNLDAAKNRVLQKYQLITACRPYAWKPECVCKPLTGPKPGCENQAARIDCANATSDCVGVGTKHIVDNNQTLLNDYARVVNTCLADFEPSNEGCHNWEFPSQTQSTRGGSCTISKFDICWQCKNYAYLVNRATGERTVDYCLTCVDLVFKNEFSSLRACIDYQIAHPK